jgi:hypothetical protein
MRLGRKSKNSAENGARAMTARAPAPPASSEGPSLSAAIVQHWFVFLLPVVLLTGAGIAAGLLRQEQYTAEARLAVQTGSNSSSLIGYADTSKALASGYSEAIDAPRVIDPASRAASISTNVARTRLSASATSDSPVVRIQATGPSKRAAVGLANYGARGLRKYVGDLNDASASKKLLRRYQDVSLRARQLSISADAAANGKAPADAVARAASEADAARIQASALKTAYENSLTTVGDTRLEILSPATTASSDRTSRLELLTFAGLVAGTLLGAALAALRARGTRGGG